MATVTIELDAQQILRLRTAFGTYLDLRDGQGQPRLATSEECRQWMIQRVREIVLAEEKAAAENAIVVDPFDPT